MSSYCVRFAVIGLPGKSPPDFTCPFPLRGMGGEQCEMERGIHLFLAHPHLGGWVASGARRKGESTFFLPTPTQGVGGELSETEGASEDPCSIINGDRSLLRECHIKNVPEGTLFYFL